MNLTFRTLQYTSSGVTGHRIKLGYFDILATGQSDIHRKIKEILLIRNLKPTLNENIGSEKLVLH